MIQYNYYSTTVDNLLTKKNRVKQLLDIWTSNHTDYSYMTDINSTDKGYELTLKVIR